jgi:hypothetical protein
MGRVGDGGVFRFPARTTIRLRSAGASGWWRFFE